MESLFGKEWLLPPPSPPLPQIKGCDLHVEGLERAPKNGSSSEDYFFLPQLQLKGFFNLLDSIQGFTNIQDQSLLFILDLKQFKL